MLVVGGRRWGIMGYEYEILYCPQKNVSTPNFSTVGLRQVGENSFDHVLRSNTPLCVVGIIIISAFFMEFIFMILN